MLRIFLSSLEVTEIQLFYADFSVQFRKWQNLVKTVIYVFWYPTKDENVRRPRLSVFKQVPLLLLQYQHNLGRLIMDGVTKMVMSCYSISLITAQNCAISENIIISVTSWTDPSVLVNTSSQPVPRDYYEFLRTRVKIPVWWRHCIDLSSSLGQP